MFDWKDFMFDREIRFERGLYRSVIVRHPSRLDVLASKRISDDWEREKLKLPAEAVHDTCWLKDRDKVTPVGILGQITIGRYLGSKTNLVSYGTFGEVRMGAHDITLRNRKTVEVKTGGKWGYDLSLGSTDVRGFRSDYGILVWRDDAYGICRNIIVGAITRERFIAEHKITDYGEGPRAYVDPRHMSMQLLFEIRKMALGDLVWTTREEDSFVLY